LNKNISERLSRKAFYDLVWSEPLRALLARFGISDVALRKACHRVDIPTPARGYWAKRASGKRIFQAPLPERAPGMSDEVVAGRALAIIKQRERIKRQTIKHRRLKHRKLAA
jgi:hypothetical protein